MKNLLLAGLLALSSSAYADVITLDAVNSGFYTNTGDNNGIASSIAAGNGQVRNWISFDLSGISGEIISASLAVENNALNDSGLQFTWSEITTPLSELYSNAGSGVDIYNDLADGTVFASGITSAGSIDNYSLTIDALSSLNNTAGLWAIGGSTANDLGLAYGFTSGVGSGDIIQLTVETYVAAIPLPAAFWLFATGLVGVAGVARRK